MLVLGIDTSCDDTSCGIVEDGRKALSNVVSSQTDLHAKYGGVVPEIASRRHLETISLVVNESLEIAGVKTHQIDAIAVTYGPGLLGSLLVGLSFAKSLAFALNVPLIGVHHIEGHIFANFLGNSEPPFPVLNLVVSGGHSDLILMKQIGEYDVIGETRDDAAGEVFDKVARELGMPFPGGPYLDRIAESGDPKAYHFTHPKLDGRKSDFSFSGTKTRALQLWESIKRDASAIPNIAASFRYSVVRDLTYHIEDLLKVSGANALAVSGGVAANSLLRKRCKEIASEAKVPLYIPDKEFCTDNGAMIAAAGYYKLKNGQVSSYDLNAYSSLLLTSWNFSGGESRG
jgi:N6-L-threonylcarbamoyladenine synthase